VYKVNHIFVGLQLYRELKYKNMHSLTYSFAYHVDSTTLADGDYEVIPDQEVEVSEDPGNTVEGLTEAPNQSSENFDPTAPIPTQEGKPQT
jgi:hypothetical protein